MKYIGPFLRMNSLNSKSIEKQLLFLAKESLKYLTLSSRCGITISPKELKTKNLPNFDINTLNSFSPLICIYKKANPKLTNIGNNLSFDTDALKKEVIIEGNALMTLSLLELIDYYNKFKDIDHKKHSLSTVYLLLARKQLEFYASNLRNIEGVFVDKKHVPYEFEEENKFEEKNKKFKYSDQALLMAAYYRYSTLDESSYGEEYKSFSLDILNMFLQFREELYWCSYEELNKICLALNLLYKSSGLQEAKTLLLDLMEYLVENMQDDLSVKDDDRVEQDCMLHLNCLMLYKNTGILKFKDKGEAIYSKLLDKYNPERGIFMKPGDKKEVDYNCTEIALYLLSAIGHSKISEDRQDDNMIIVDIFRRQMIDSGIIISWPSSPDLDDLERYRHYISKAENLLEEQEFRMASLPSPESVELAPVFIKSVTYNRKKETFSQGKLSFDSAKNMLIFFMIVYLSKLFGEDLAGAVEG